MNRPLRIRMRGGVGAEGEKPLATRFGRSRYAAEKHIHIPAGIISKPNVG